MKFWISALKSNSRRKMIIVRVIPLPFWWFIMCTQKFKWPSSILQRRFLHLKQMSSPWFVSITGTQLQMQQTTSWYCFVLFVFIFIYLFIYLFEKNIYLSIYLFENKSWHFNSHEMPYLIFSENKLYAKFCLVLYEWSIADVHFSIKL